MKIQSSVKIVLAATYVPMDSCLHHEKSFLASDGVSTVQSMAVHNNSLFISTSNDVVQKDIGTGSIQRMFRDHKEMIQSFVIADDSRMITSSYDGTVIIWSLSTGSILRRISSESSRIQISKILFDDKNVVIGGREGDIRRIDATTALYLLEARIFQS
ncbi:hypothetical protein MP638_006233 [Amoeboaphelidium occidentale]|nr:hypothetical protein MP638_006233 [Amoeboaphelidium occidentale]